MELFAYVPRSVYPYLDELTNPGYTHRYFVDGPVVEGDVFFNNSWKTVVMGSADDPAGLFALNVTPTRPVRSDEGAVGYRPRRGAGPWEGDRLRVHRQRQERGKCRQLCGDRSERLPEHQQPRGPADHRHEDRPDA